MALTKVVNKHTEKYDVYIGRPTIFGNPFAIGRDGDRAEVIIKYRKYFNERIQNDTEFKERVLALKGKTLGCYCKPLPCHGDAIVEYLEGAT